MVSCAAALLLLRPLPLHVEGNRLLEAGAPVILKGVGVPSFESSNEGEYVFRSARVAFEDWQANCIRLPVSEDRWFGKAEGQKDKGLDYRVAVNEVINLAENRSRYLILDLQSSDANVWGKNLGPHDMPDDHSLQFWRDIGASYRGYPHVLFGLYDAPHDVPWSVWRNGGDVSEAGLSYHAPGMQTLLEAIRRTGAKNVCVVGGLDGGYDLTGIADGYALTDEKGNGVVYDAHIFPSRADWESKVACACPIAPVIVGECGCLPTDKPIPDEYVPKLFAFIEAHSLSWIASGFHPSAKPNLIGDWVYTPTPFWGTVVKKKLAN
jgi:endoglucanase